MLAALSIRDVVLIDKLDLEFTGGLWALTGETGAGKSILLDSLGLAVGARANKGLVRQGCAQGVVTALFDVEASHPIWRFLAENELGDGPDLILRRVQLVDGRSRAFINDQPVSVATLRLAGEFLLEVHGQHDERGLLNASAHRALLDAFGGLVALAKETGESFTTWQEAENELQNLRATIEKAAKDEDYLRHVISELSQLNPQDKEEEAAAQERASLMNAEKITAELDAAAKVLSGSGGLESKLNSALRSLERVASHASETLGPVIEALDRALVEAGEARSLVDETIRAHQFDQKRLEAVEERLFALRAAARKHDVPVTHLPTLRADLEAQLGSIETGQEDLSQCEKKAAEAKTAFLAMASELSAKRQKAAKKLDKAVMSELGPLKLDRARFETVVSKLEEDKIGVNGIDDVRFMIATNPGAPLGALNKIASGGELARFILALKASLAAKEGVTAIVFDEVDSGVGGAVSHAVGERLAKLAETAQVLVVTHSPQVAARAGHHLRVSKNVAAKGATTTSVSALDEAEREEEIARMLSAAKVTKEARAAAASLLSGDDVEAQKTGTSG